ncbi:MAG: hypothetical protein LBC18_04760 [Opitutaceae bacterium]|jgi:hypothetical protein|nr:hypothetical protein [Opitutaceae bacterium]
MKNIHILKAFASIFIAICIILFSGCVSGEKARLQLLSQIAPCDVKLQFDNPDEILDAAYREDVVSGLKPKDRFEIQDEYQKRIAATWASTNLEGRTFTVLIPASFIQYTQPEGNAAQWLVLLSQQGTPYTNPGDSRVLYFSVRERILLEEKQTRQQFRGKDRWGKEIWEPYEMIFKSAQVLELNPSRTLSAGNTPIAWRSGGTLGYFGLLIDKNDADFRQKMRDKKISLAIRFTVRSIQSASYFFNEYFAHGIDSNRYYNEAAIFRLPADITDVWCVDLTNGHAFAHWPSEKSGP